MIWEERYFEWKALGDFFRENRESIKAANPNSFAERERAIICSMQRLWREMESLLRAEEIGVHIDEFLWIDELRWKFWPGANLCLPY